MEKKYHHNFPSFTYFSLINLLTAALKRVKKKVSCGHLKINLLRKSLCEAGKQFSFMSLHYAGGSQDLFRKEERDGTWDQHNVMKDIK